MTRINLLTKENAPDKSKEILVEIEQKNGKVINIFKTMANSSAVLQTYFAIDKALSEKTLDGATAERIALAVSATNSCPYCIAAHSYLAKKALSEEEIVKARNGKSNDVKAQAVLDFAVAVMKKTGNISDEEFAKIKGAGFSDGEIIEMVTIVAQTFFTNIVNNVAQTTVDFPKIKE